MKKLVVFLFLIIFYTGGYSQEVKSKKCVKCGKPISECPYKGKHPATCSICGKVLQNCPYKGHHPTYIKANGSVTLNLQVNNQSALRTISVSTDASSYTTYGVPSWCSVESKTSSQFILRITENTSTSPRSDWMELRTSNGKSARINISQSARPANKGSYIRINGNTTVNKSFSANSTTVTFNITTDADSWSTWGVPSWCTVENKTSSSFSLRVNKNTSSESRSDYMEVRTPSGSSARLNIVQNASAYLKVNNYSDGITTTFDDGGGRKTYTVQTNAGAYELWGVPSFCEIQEKTSTSFTLVCDRNTNRSERGDYFKVKAAGKEIRIDVKQKAATGPSASIDNVWVEHNIPRTGYNNVFNPVFGWQQVPFTYLVMRIHMDFNVDNMKGKTIRVCAFFFDEDGDKITTSNNQFRAPNGQVTVQDTGNSPYTNSKWSDFTLEIPYSVMRKGSNKFYIQIQDSNGNTLTTSDFVYFTVS